MKTKECFKKIYSKDYFILIGIGFLPLIWKILEIAFLASSAHALKILGQIAFISIIFKIFEESILNPLYKMFSKESITDEDNKNSIANKFLIVYTIATIVFSALLIIFCKEILQISQVPSYIFNDTLIFIKIYIIASGFGVISKYLYTFNLINKNTKKMLIYFLIKSVATTILFICFVPKFTLNLGVYGIALAELIINVTTIIFLGFSSSKFKANSTKLNIKLYLKLFAFSLAETLIRNIVYYFVILTFLNIIDNQELYFVSNEYIWSIMLIPTLAQTSLIKQEFTNNKESSLKPYFINSSILISFMIILIPVSLIIFKHIYVLPNYLEYFVVLIKLFPCYIIFVIDSIIESYFIATGKLHHVLMQSIITNILLYLTALILYLFGIWTITLDSIILLFNLGVVISSAYTISMYLIERKKTTFSQKQKTNE